ncbi:MAG: biotin synthase BioB [Anaerostipes sp.]|nr:biotin synthase BioB [Anaerostipes sp.]MBS7008272.1 biotin synthase BioB [Anaerostipes sp.]
MKDLTERIISGEKVFSKSEDLTIFIHSDLDELCREANRLREYFCGNHGDLCTIINGKSGKCSEDCRFCAQSVHHRTQAGEYAFLPVEEILKDCKAQEEKGVHRYSIVTAGKGIEGDDFLRALEAYRSMSLQSTLSLCASHGFLSYEAFLKLKENGVTRYHCNLETSGRFFSQICSTHTYDDKINNIKRARKAGLEICSGGIIGMGETMEDRMSMALDLAELKADSIPINILTPIPGTPLADRERLHEEEILRTIAAFRFLNPRAEIRLAAGRSLMEDCGKRAFLSGANGAITGDMLTTSGNKTEEDRQLLIRLGYTLN